MNGITFFYFLVGFMIVFLFSIKYFNQPSYNLVDVNNASADDQDGELLEPALPKYLTERFEYNLFLSVYVLVTELIYVLLVIFMPDLISNGKTQDRNTFVPSQENIVLATLIITGIAPNLPFVSSLLESSKRFLHEKAQIPQKGYNVYKQIKNHTPLYSSSLIVNILKDERYLQDVNGGSTRIDLDFDDFKLATWTLEARWAKLSYLLNFLDRCSETKPYQAYIGYRELRYSSIEKSYGSLQRLMANHKTGNLSDEDNLKLNARLDTTLNRTYRLISCLLYLAGKTEEAVDNKLDELGYDVKEHNDFPIPWKTVVMITAAVAASIVVGSILTIIISYYGLTALNVNISTKEILSWTGYGVPFIVVPVIMVLFIKRFLSMRSKVWPVVIEFNRYKTLVDRPWHIYFIVALFSYLIGALVLYGLSITVTMLKEEDVEWIKILRAVLAWSAVVFITSGYTAFRLDSAPTPKIINSKQMLSRSKQLLSRYAGALTQGVLTSGVIYFVYVHTNDLPLNLVRIGQQDSSKLLVLCLIGLFLGVSVNVATGVGRLRQRRKYARKLVRRPLMLHLEGESTEAETLNISQQGARIKVKKPIISLINSADREGKNVTVTNANGTKVEAKVINIHGDHLLLLFEDVKNWLSFQGELGIHVP